MTEHEPGLSLASAGAYSLLEGYIKEAEHLSEAYSLSADYFRFMHKLISYPLVVVTAVNSVFAAAGSHVPHKHYILIALSLCSLILAGFGSLLNPQEKASRADQVSTKFGEIAADARQFLFENNKNKQEIKTFSQLTHELIDIWKSLMPPIKKKFLKITNQTTTQ